VEPLRGAGCAEGAPGLSAASRSPPPRRGAALDSPRRLWQLYPAACFSLSPAKGHVLKAAAGFGDIKSRGRRKRPAQLHSWPCQGMRAAAPGRADSAGSTEPRVAQALRQQPLLLSGAKQPGLSGTWGQ